MEEGHANKYAIWVITPGGIRLAREIIMALDAVDLYLSGGMGDAGIPCFRFESLRAKLTECFNQYCGHIFIMATGIVVRIIAPLVKDKTVDPAVVVLDDKGNHCISLLSGHLGGANALARQICRIVGAEPVITTATDVNDLPSVDLIAREFGLAIENSEAIKNVNMAFLEQRAIRILDPYGLFQGALAAITPGQPPAGFRIDNFTALSVPPEARRRSHSTPYSDFSFWPCEIIYLETCTRDEPMIYVGDEIREFPRACLVLRPRILVAGIGCNRGTVKEEIEACLHDVFFKHQLSPKSLCALATIDIKKDEGGLVELAEAMGIPILFYSSDELKSVKGVETPSSLVKKYTGVESVCEGAALLGAKTCQLLVPKEVAKNVTVAVARTVSM